MPIMNSDRAKQAGPVCCLLADEATLNYNTIKRYSTFAIRMDIIAVRDIAMFEAILAEKIPVTYADVTRYSTMDSVKLVNVRRKLLREKDVKMRQRKPRKKTTETSAAQEVFSGVEQEIHTDSMNKFHPVRMIRVFHSRAISDTIEVSGGMDMQIRLAENIRALRRQHRFTQEQLAESLGVTPGAVYKWEAGLSQPELAIIVELADLFDTSVDVLLGYEMKDNRRQTAAERLQRYRVEKDRTGLAEAEKALQKYPNDFEIVYRSAALYRVFGIVETDEALLRRAEELGCDKIVTGHYARVERAGERYILRKALV